MEVHKSRLFDLGAGLGVSVEAPLRIVTARSTALLKKAKEDFRSFIDSATPSIYLIDIDSQVIDPIYNTYNITIDKPRFREQLNARIERFSDPITVEHFSSSIEHIVNKVETTLNRLIQTSSAHLEYRNVYYNAGKELSKLFTKSVMRFSNPEALGHPGKLVLLGKSFSNMRDYLNAGINITIRNNSTDTKASFGSIMAAGHTGVSLGDGNFGINTPASQEALFKIEAAGLLRGDKAVVKEKEFTDNFVKKVDLFLNTSITFNENFTKTSKTLLSLGFTFVVPMDTKLNSASGSKERAYIESITKTLILPGLADAMKKRLSNIKDYITSVRGSPTITEFIAAMVTSTIEGKATKTSVYKETKRTKEKLNVSLPAIKLDKFKVSKPKAVPRLNRNSKPKVAVSNLATLESLLRSKLYPQIVKNMGTGNSRNVLNFRSGRFAHSAKVERISQSREGMISVFYSYMRNPYGTFSEGGRQEFPRTRDPKTLISKSIREIGASAAYNRMRAVLV